MSHSSLHQELTRVRELALVSRRFADEVSSSNSGSMPPLVSLPDQRIDAEWDWRRHVELLLPQARAFVDRAANAIQQARRKSVQDARTRYVWAKNKLRSMSPEQLWKVAAMSPAEMEMVLTFLESLVEGGDDGVEVVW